MTSYELEVLKSEVAELLDKCREGQNFELALSTLRLLNVAWLSGMQKGLPPVESDTRPVTTG